jgi:hypothetical protein
MRACQRGRAWPLAQQQLEQQQATRQAAPAAASANHGAKKPVTIQQGSSRQRQSNKRCPHISACMRSHTSRRQQLRLARATPHVLRCHDQPASQHLQANLAGHVNSNHLHPSARESAAAGTRPHLPLTQRACTRAVPASRQPLAHGPATLQQQLCELRISRYREHTAALHTPPHLQTRALSRQGDSAAQPLQPTCGAAMAAARAMPPCS